MSDEFVFPEMHIGDPVEVWADPSLGNVGFGQVIRVMGSAVDVFCVDGQGGKVRRSCLHKNDPRIHKFVDRFRDNMSGVFELANTTKRTRAAEARLKGLEKAVEELAAEIARTNRPSKK